MKGWFVELSGDKSDLRVLADNFGDPDLSVETYKDGYVLTSSDFLALPDVGSILEHARGLVELMNGSISIGDRSQRPVSVTGVFYLREDGGRDVFAFPEPIKVRLRMHAVATVIGSSSLPAPPELPSGIVRLNAARNNSHIEEVLRGFGNAEPDFAVLHRLLEAMEVDLGGEDELYAKNWASRKKLKLFTRTANTIGRRHASGKFQPPVKPMPIEEARTLVREIAQAWLRDVYGIR